MLRYKLVVSFILIKFAFLGSLPLHDVSNSLQQEGYPYQKFRFDSCVIFGLGNWPGASWINGQVRKLKVLVLYLYLTDSIFWSRKAGPKKPHVWLLQETDYFTPQGEFRVDAAGSPTLLNCLMYKLSYFRFGELQVSGEIYEFPYSHQNFLIMSL